MERMASPSVAGFKRKADELGPQISSTQPGVSSVSANGPPLWRDSPLREHSLQQLSSIRNCPIGLQFIAMGTKSGKFFLSSTSNYFGRAHHQVKCSRLLCNNSCNSLLLVFEDTAHLQQTFDTFHQDEYKCEFLAREPGSPMIIAFKPVGASTAGFEARLCSDLFPEAPAIAIDKLRFCICSEDLKYIVDTPACINRFPATEMMRLLGMDEANGYYDTYVSNVSTVVKVVGKYGKEVTPPLPLFPRRTHGLLGQQIISQFAALKVGDIQFYVDHTFELPATMNALDIKMSRVADQIRMPPQFQEWKDDFGEDDPEIV